MARKQFSSSRYKFNNTKWLIKSEGTLQNQEIWDFCLREILRCHVPIHTVWSKKKLKNKGPYHLRLLLAAYFCPSPFSFNANSKLETKIKHSPWYRKTTITKKEDFGLSVLMVSFSYKNVLLTFRLKLNRG